MYNNDFIDMRDEQDGTLAYGMTEARNNLGDLVKAVHSDRKRVILEKGGLPVAAVVSIEDFNQLVADKKNNYKSV